MNMTKSALLLLSSLVVVTHAATLQDPVYTSAYYTSVYPGFHELNAINNNGLAVGEQFNEHPNRFTGNDFSALAYNTLTGSISFGLAVPNPNDSTRLTGINDTGSYVGYGAPSTSSSAFSGFVNSIQTQYAPATLLNVPGAISTFPLAINDAGVIVGSYISAVDNLEHGFIYRPDGTFQTLDNPASPNTALVGINNHGQIVGASSIAISPSTNGFFYSSGSLVQLDYGRPVGINDSGAILVEVNPNAIAMHVPNPDPRAGAGILYPNGTLALLYGTDPFSPQIPEAINGSAAINNEGVVIFDSAHAFVATPVVPEPASAGLLAVGALGLVSLHVRRRSHQARPNQASQPYTHTDL